MLKISTQLAHVPNANNSYATATMAATEEKEEEID